MTPSDIFHKFLEVYPIGYDEVVRYLVMSPNVIQVRLKNRKELVFTYISSNKWRIDSMDLYKSEMKKIEKKK